MLIVISMLLIVIIIVCALFYALGVTNSYLFFVSLEPTMTSDIISKVVATLGEDKLGVVLDVPESKREEFRQQSSTTADYRLTISSSTPTGRAGVT